MLGVHTSSSSESSFVIFAEEQIDYAISIQNVLEFTFRPESSIGTSVVVDGESIPCIPINGRVTGMRENRVCCVLCKDSQGAKIMLSFGHQAEYEYQRFFIKNAAAVARYFSRGQYNGEPMRYGQIISNSEM